jgi:hypothetical protein
MDIPPPHSNPDGNLQWLDYPNMEYTAPLFALMIKQVFPHVQKRQIEQMRQEFVRRHFPGVTGRNTTGLINYRQFIAENIEQLGVVNSDDHFNFDWESSFKMGVYFETSNRRLQTMAWYARAYIADVRFDHNYQEALEMVDQKSPLTCCICAVPLDPSVTAVLCEAEETRIYQKLMPRHAICRPCFIRDQSTAAKHYHHNPYGTPCISGAYMGSGDCRSLYRDSTISHYFPQILLHQLQIAFDEDHDHVVHQHD